jgi:hypothetical protein
MADRDPADELEMTIPAVLARENFGGALEYLRLLPDPMKMQVPSGMVQSLLEPY